MKKYIFISITLIFALSLQLVAQKNEKAEIYMKNGNIFLVYIRYVPDSAKLRLNTFDGNSILISRSDISAIKSLQNVNLPRNKFYGNLRLGTCFSFNDDVFGGSFSASAGYRIRPQIGVGWVAGIQSLDRTSYPVGVEISYELKPKGYNLAPKFLRLQGGVSIQSKGLQNEPVYYDFWNTTNYLTDAKVKNGIWIHPEAGVRFSKRSNDSFYISIGYLFQNYSIEYTYTYDNNFVRNEREAYLFYRFTLSLGYFF